MFRSGIKKVTFSLASGSNGESVKLRTSKKIGFDELK